MLVFIYHSGLFTIYLLRPPPRYNFVLPAMERNVNINYFHGETKFHFGSHVNALISIKTNGLFYQRNPKRLKRKCMTKIRKKFS